MQQGYCEDCGAYFYTGIGDSYAYQTASRLCKGLSEQDRDAIKQKIAGDESTPTYQWVWIVVPSILILLFVNICSCFVIISATAAVKKLASRDFNNIDDIA